MDGSVHPLTASVAESASGELPPFFAEDGFENVITDLKGPYEVLSDGETRVARVAYNGLGLVVRTIGTDYSDEEAPSGVEDLTHRIKGLVRGLGITGLEQMVSYSLEDPEDPIVVTKANEGATLDDLSLSQIEGITEDQYDSLLDTLEAAADRGLAPDTAWPGNFIYHPQHGFALIDYTAVDTGERGLQPSPPVAEFCKFLGLTKDLLDLSGRHLRDDLYKKAWREALQKGLTVLEKRYPNAINELPDSSQSLQHWLSLSTEHFAIH